jgi:hypothetical protein
MRAGTCTFRLSPELSHRLDDRASEWGVSRSEVIRLGVLCLDQLLDPTLMADPSVLALLGSKADLAARIGDALASDPVAEAMP